MQSMSTRTLAPRSAVMRTDETCDDVTIILLLVHGTTTWFGGVTHDGFVDIGRVHWSLMRAAAAHVVAIGK